MSSPKPAPRRISSPLKRRYIIDGIPQQLTPEAMLFDCAGKEAPTMPLDAEPIADETLDIAPGTFPDDGTAPEDYLPTVLSALDKPRRYPFTFPESYTCARIASALLEVLFRGGHVRLDELSADLEWSWNSEPMGNMASLYASVAAACEYIDNLGITLRKWNYTEAETCSLTVRICAGTGTETVLDEDLMTEEEVAAPGKFRLGRKRSCAGSLDGALASDWIAFIPFDSCQPRLGGSVLAEAIGAPSATAPDIGDADYFIDCFEVVRELVEDGIVKAGVPVGPGGLMAALSAMTVEDTGAEIDITGLRRSWEDTLPARVLYGEVPGVLVVISDIDFDYLDAELVLQDVAYFPLGHPTPGKAGVQVLHEGAGISSILDSLLGASEGED